MDARRLAHFTAVYSVFSKNLLDSEELVVLGNTIGAAKRAGFDLSRVRGDCDVSDGGVFCFTRAMGDDSGVAVLFREFDGVEGFGQRTDLVHFNENRVGDAVFESFSEEFDVGDEKVIADELSF